MYENVSTEFQFKIIDNDNPENSQTFISISEFMDDKLKETGELIGPRVVGVFAHLLDNHISQIKAQIINFLIKTFKS